MSHSSDRINKLAAATKAAKYLEIGVDKGDTFFNVEMPFKVAVDPSFKFSVIDNLKDGCFFYPLLSNTFFERLPSMTELAPFQDAKGKISFDIIFLDGLHTYKQTLKDFENSLPYSHDDTIWILDDTVPCDPFSAVPDQADALKYRKAAGLRGLQWHGDVFKVIFSLHDDFKDFSYCTVINQIKPQTIVWKTPSPRTDAGTGFGREKIALLDYFKIFEYSHLFMPANENSLFNLLGKTLNPSAYREGMQWKRLVYFQAGTEKEQKLAAEVGLLKEEIASLKARLTNK